MPRAKSPAWTSEERAILIELYPAMGLGGVADALPDRSWQAIYVMANKLGLRTVCVASAPEPKLQGERLEEAIRLREIEGWSFARIGAHLGVAEASACNAVLIALCPRKGFRPAERDPNGRLTPEGLERLRYALRKGMKGVDIQLRLGVSASCVAEQRRRYQADLKARDKAPLPPPGAGVAYSGVKVPVAKRREVEALLLDGFGAKRVTAQTGVSKTTVGRIRNRLVKRLARKGECLPGCDLAGRRIGAAKASTNYIPPQSIAELRERILAREPVARAARALGIGGCSAYRIRDQLAAEMAAQGQSLPAPERLGRSAEARRLAREASWLPAGMMRRFRHLSSEIGPGAAKAQIIEEIAADKAAAIAARQAEAARPKTFEEKLELVRNGARIVTVTPLCRPGPMMTLGGIATGAL